jgi:tetratricopeptide (TPR) repeat protein
MGILNKLFTGSKGKLPGQLKQADKLIEQGKLTEATQQLDEVRELFGDGADDTVVQAHNELRRRLIDELLKGGQRDAALQQATDLAKEDDDGRLAIGEILVNHSVVDERSLAIIRRAVDENPREKKMLLNLAKSLLKARGDQFSKDELAFLSATAKVYPLWKDGQGILADHFLREGRRDAEALTVYRNAYPNRKADRRLREVLLESLLENNEKDDFAAAVYEEVVITTPNPQALKLLAEYYISVKKELTPSNIPYIERALEVSKFETEELRQLAELVLESKDSFVNRLELLQLVYEQGYADRGLLEYLAEALSQANKFDDRSIEIMTRAFEQRVVSKRAILILTEHCLANDRDDEFAIRVYETYMSTWPDRPQRRIYSILGHKYAALTRVDDQAQKIYEEALVDSPTDPIVLTILARAYHAADRRDEEGEEIYRHAFPIVDDEVKKQLAEIMAEIRVEKKEFNEETLQYLTVVGRPKHGPLAEKYDEYLTNCFLATGRRGEQAQEAYFALFEKTEDSESLNPRLVSLLADIIKERGGSEKLGDIALRVYRKLFEQQKFATDADISFELLNDELGRSKHQLNLVHVCVRCFEADSDKLIEVLKASTRETLLQEVGDFYIEHFNFPLAAEAYKASFDLSQTDDIRYRLAKIYLMDGNGQVALELLEQLSDQSYAVKRDYWEAVAYQQLQEPDKSEDRLAKAEQSGQIEPYLLKLRRAINLELRGELEGSLERYAGLANAKGFEQFNLWIQLELGIVMMKLDRLEDAREHLEEIHRLNPNGRAEQLFLSLALFHQAHAALKEKDYKTALPLFTRAVEVNRNHRLLRQVIVELLSLYGKRDFFNDELERCVEIMEVCHRILPKNTETRTYLAYAYHRMKDYARAIIFYRDLSWEDEDPRLERSQAYAYLANHQPAKAWRVFLDLARRGNLTRGNFARVVGCFLQDPEAYGGRYWINLEFPEDIDSLMLIALLIHDGQNQEAVEQIEARLKEQGRDPRMLWYLGKAYSALGKRDLAVHNWKTLLQVCSESESARETKIRQFAEIGLAFLEAGYAEEAMQTWEGLRKLDEGNRDLPLLYAETLNLNAYQLARKGQAKMSRDEWAKALKYDQNNPLILQNYAIACLQVDDTAEATRQFRKLSDIWQQMLKAKPEANRHMQKSISHLEHAMNTMALTKGRPEHDVTKARAEDALDVYRKANQFYWILSLDKRATTAQIENEYFRLIKIFNPERHADDFMLVEESYTNLFKNVDRRGLIDTFVYNPIDTAILRRRMKRLPYEAQVSFEKLDIPQTLPPPDYQQLTPPKADESDVAAPLLDLLVINYKIPDWTLL